VTDSTHADPLGPSLPLDETTERRGRLKIFLGYAPGVGKTHAMLVAAIARKLDGADLVVGVVDTHGRKEIAELLAGLELAPTRSGGDPARPAEMDLDAILKRKPRLVLVDNLAHSNQDGGWHARRHEDVEHLLESGIDVYTTLNIQELGSLADIVARISKLEMRDTVPDSLVQQAEEMELVDLSPSELLLRLKQGRVHVSEQDRGHMEQYFTVGNLTALRELALRHMAERVDQQMLTYRQAHAISGVWPTRERILVCIGEAPVVARLVRLTKRVADRRKVPWIALYIETHRHQNYTEEQRTRINDALRLAEQLGGEAVTLAGSEPVAEILNYAESRNVTQIIIGKSRRPRWLSAFSPSVVDQLLHEKSSIDLLVVTPEANIRHDPTEIPVVTQRKPIPWNGYAKAVGALAIATLVNFLLAMLVPSYVNYAVIYLTTVILIAIRQGRGPAIFAAILTAPIIHFMFVEPRYSIEQIYRIDPIALIIFLGSTVIISNLAERVRAQIAATRLSERRSKNLYDFNRKIASAVSLDDVLWAVVHHVASTIDGNAIVMMPKNDRLEIAAAYPPEMHMDDMSEAAADWAWRQGKPAGRGSSTLPGAGWLFLPLKTARGVLGVLGVQIQGKARLLTSEQTRLLDTLADQAAVAVERTNLVSDFEDTRLLMETEKLRAALLSSLSHDLRTPLVSILGSATTLIDLDGSIDKETETDLLHTIREEAERLNRFVQNLLDMTRLGSGALQPKQDWIEIGDVIGAALRRVSRQLDQRKVDVEIETGLPMLYIDFVLIEQVMINIVENACKYSPPESRIVIGAKRDGANILVRTCDEGKGISYAERALVFDMFYRVKATDSQVAGTGLGLAICRGIIEAHGGMIRVTDTGTGIGTCIEFTLPLRAVPTLEEAETVLPLDEP
jgi:two-component system sensor histidine kinase KdpD